MTFAQKIEDENQKKPISEALLEELKLKYPKYINDTINSIISDTADIIVENNSSFYNHFIENYGPSKECLSYIYAVIAMKTDNFDEFIKGKKINKNNDELNEQLIQRLINNNHTFFAKGSDGWLEKIYPFKSIIDGSCSKKPDDEVFFQICSDTQNIMKLIIFEGLEQLDPEYKLLNEMEYPDNSNVREVCLAYKKEIENTQDTLNYRTL